MPQASGKPCACIQEPEAPEQYALLKQGQSHRSFVPGIPGCCADVKEAAQPYLRDKLDEEEMGTSLKLCSVWHRSSSVPGLCWDLSDLGGKKPVCAGVSVCDGTAESRKENSAVQVLLHPGVQTVSLLQASFWR